jgi:hypothetical protein
MANISLLSRLVNGVQRQVDLSANTLVVDALKVGGGAGTDLTKAILDNLINLQNGSDFANGTNAHTHDGRYFTESELSASGASSGSDLIGDDDTYNNFTPSAATVKGALQGIDSALAAVSANGEFSDSVFRIEDNADDTKKIAFEASGIATGTTRTITMPNADVNLGALTNSNIASNAAIALSKLAALATGRALVSDGSGVISAHGSTTSTEIGYLAGVTSGIQAQLDGKIDESREGQANGIATLDGSGKVPVSQLPNAIMEYQGVWNATTNSPALADGAGNADTAIGNVYRVSVAGSQDLGSGSISFAVGDYVILNASKIWEKADTTDAVSSVFGRTGAVTAQSGDYNTDQVTEGTNKYFTDERAQDAVGSILADSSTIDFTYDDATPSVTAAVKADSISNSHIASNAAIAYSKLNLANSIVGADLAPEAVSTAKIQDGAVTKDKLNSNAFDQSTITGGAGETAVVVKAPKVSEPMVAGESFAANTSFLVRWAMNGETAGRVYKADKDASVSDKFWVIGIAHSTSAVSAGQNIEVISLGEYTLGSSDTAFNAADIGKPVWLTAAGAFSVTAPTGSGEANIAVGIVKATNKIWVQPREPKVV